MVTVTRRSFLAEVARSRAAHAATAAEPTVHPLWDPRAYREALADGAERADDLALVDDGTRQVLDAFEAEMVRHLRVRRGGVRASRG